MFKEELTKGGVNRFFKNNALQLIHDLLGFNNAKQWHYLLDDITNSKMRHSWQTYPIKRAGNFITQNILDVIKF